MIYNNNIKLHTNEDLLSIIQTFYGNSKVWIVELADLLHTTYNTARNLTREAGFYRHKQYKKVTLKSFTTQPYAMKVIKEKNLKIV